MQRWPSYLHEDPQPKVIVHNAEMHVVAAGMGCAVFLDSFRVGDGEVPNRRVGIDKGVDTISDIGEGELVGGLFIISPYSHADREGGKEGT